MRHGRVCDTVAKVGALKLVSLKMGGPRVLKTKTAFDPSGSSNSSSSSN